MILCANCICSNVFLGRTLSEAICIINAATVCADNACIFLSSKTDQGLWGGEKACGLFIYIFLPPLARRKMGRKTQ